MTSSSPIDRSAVRKHQILEAAAVVFAQKGFHATTTRDIAKQASIAEGTIYTYFDSKSALLLGIFDRMRDTIVQAAPADLLDSTDIRTVVRRLLRHPLMALQEDNFALFRIVMSEMLVNEELRTMYRQQIVAPTLALADAHFKKLLVATGRTRKEAHLTIPLISAMVSGLMLNYLLEDPALTADWDSVPDVLADLLVSGLESHLEGKAEHS